MQQKTFLNGKNSHQNSIQMMYPSAQKKSQTGKINHNLRSQLLDHNDDGSCFRASNEIERGSSAIVDQSNVQQRRYRPTQMMFSHVGDTDNEPVTPKSPPKSPTKSA